METRLLLIALLYISVACSFTENRKDFSNSTVRCWTSKSEPLVERLYILDSLLREEGIIKNQNDYLELINLSPQGEIITKLNLTYVDAGYEKVFSGIHNSPVTVTVFIQCIQNESSSLFLDGLDEKLIRISFLPSKHMLEQALKENRMEPVLETEATITSIKELREQELALEVTRLTILFAYWQLLERKG